MNTVAVRRVCIPLESSAGTHARTAAVCTILVAFGDPDLRDVSMRVLQGAGYRVLSARHSGHALLACLTGGRIDVLLADRWAGDSSGAELARRLGRHNPDLRAVFLSTNPRENRHDVLVQPFTANDLLEAVNRKMPRSHC